MPICSKCQKAMTEEETIRKRSPILSPKNHWFPAILSFFIPGLGQIIQGRILRAILMWIILIALSWTIIVPIIVWLWNIYDAYSYQSSGGFFSTQQHDVQVLCTECDKVISPNTIEAISGLVKVVLVIWLWYYLKGCF